MMRILWILRYRALGSQEAHGVHLQEYGVGNHWKCRTTLQGSIRAPYTRPVHSLTMVAYRQRCLEREQSRFTSTFDRATILHTRWSVAQNRGNVSCSLRRTH